MPDILKELREKQAKIVHDARGILAEVDKNDTTEERAQELEGQYDAAMAEYDQIGERIQREERLARANAALESGDARAPEQVDSEAEGRAEVKPTEYRETFAKAIKHGMSALSQEERQQMADHLASVPQEIRAQATGTDAAGGYTVPTELLATIEKSMAAWGPMLDGGVIDLMQTDSGNPIELPTVDDTANGTELVAENAAVTDDGSGDIVFGQKSLGAYLCGSKMVRVPIQLLTDSAYNIDRLVSELFGERLSRGANKVLTTGTGSSQPAGIVTGSAAGTTAAATAAITSDEILDLIHSVDPAYRDAPTCRLMFNDDTLKAIRKLKDGNGNYLWQLGNIQSGEPNLIAGYRYSVNQAMDSLAAAKKVVLFGDMKKYLVRRVGTPQMIRLSERYAENLQVGFMAYTRLDGVLTNSAAVKHLITAAS
ncbi:MAG: phage major capsid protein [Kordiimonas sp.]|nr:phage major capsid protein [Kordiimonas sp.]